MKSKFVFSILAFLILFVFPNTYAQSGKVPPFRMVQSNGKIFKAEYLPIGKPIVIIYFSPECEDCHKLIGELLTRINDLKSASITLITYLSVQSVSQFVTENNLAKFSNIFVGTKGNSLFVKNYYNIEQFPFMALYNGNGDLIKKYTSKEINLSDLIYQLKLI